MKSLKICLIAFIYIISSFVFADNDNKATVIAPYQMQAYDQAIKRLYATVHGSHSNHMIERLDADSSYFLGKPYVLGNLGEGPTAQFDQQPLYRTDIFDCQTYVSTVLALIEADNFHDFTRNVLHIGYKDSVATFLNRNHFVSVDWNINNEKNGFIKDVTQALFPHEYKIANALIDKPNWYLYLKPSRLKLLAPLSQKQTQSLLQSLHDLSKQTHAVTSHLPYVPLTALYNQQGTPNDDLFNRIPSGTVIEIVRPNWSVRSKIGTNMNISHLGFGIRKNGILYFREASSIQNKVIDIPLTDYLKNYLNSDSVKGIHIEEIILK